MLDKDLMPYFQPSAIRCLPDEIFKVGPQFLKENWSLTPFHITARSRWQALYSRHTTGLLLTVPEESYMLTMDKSQDNFRIFKVFLKILTYVLIVFIFMVAFFL